MAKKVIGVTGGIGSGKTKVCEIIQEQGFPVYYSDIEAKEIVNRNKYLKQNIIALLGEEAYNAEGIYNRSFVAQKVFNDDILLQKLNSLIHPAVREHFDHWITLQESEYVFKETALLFELKLNESCYRSLLVTAEDNLRIKRVMDRDGKTYREVEAVIQRQMPEKEKIKIADFVIENNSTLEELRTKTLDFLQTLTAENFIS